MKDKRTSRDITIDRSAVCYIIMVISLFLALLSAFYWQVRWLFWTFFTPFVIALVALVYIKISAYENRTRMLPVPPLFPARLDELQKPEPGSCTRAVSV